MTDVKICGLTDEESIDAAIEAGAEYLGFVFFAKSPRALTAERAAELTQFIEGVQKVGLFVDPDDSLLNDVLTHVRLDLLQFHGAETPERLTQIRDEYCVPVMKVIPVAEAIDLQAAIPFYDVVDQLLFDAKPPKGSDLPGGNAVSFDWSILKGFKCPVPWMLAGGLTPVNVAEAIKATGAKAVDVSSGVESAPGVKDVGKIRAFIAAAQGG
ncbi:MAG: phosphoribosylanthranilate isomerase [Rhodospirillaceae bacterium]|nr:phosphoribosylanthranilate isomerase [Rhodospirillales bacterium]